MALNGTLRDFGIADILQLIAQQQKTGTLHLTSKDQEVHIGFQDGVIVQAESSTRRKKDLFGTMLVRAEIITELQLEEALETQKRTLQRLGDVLVSTGVITKDRYRQMAQLQFNETLYRLFSWKSGTYNFEQETVHYDPADVTPVRAESVLMEGFRMVDEWPVIRKRLPRYDLVFERVRDLPSRSDPGLAEDRRDRRGDFASLGESERRVYALVTPARDVRKLIDLSCLGEFETCKALCNLVNLEILKPLPGLGDPDPLQDEVSVFDRVRGTLGRIAVSTVVLAGLVLVAVSSHLNPWSLSASTRAAFEDSAVQQAVARAQVSRLEAALDVYRLEKGEYPPSLQALVDVRLVSPSDLHYPWREVYYYRRVAPQQFILLPPLR
ncbi:MAG TPA: DUF4388 domain-containing protein [Myxococcaceae bacterium]|jgi:hypothetical protein|nr:DUF4388 domain-containing protein [Myxococcaceae bacterium]